MQRTFLPLCVVSLFLASCASEPPAPKINIAAEQAKIREHESAMGKDWAAKDADKIAAHYAADAILMTDGMNPINGKDIAGGMKAMMSDPNLKLDMVTDQVEVAQAADLAYTRGHYAMTMSDPKSKKPNTVKGSYLTVYKKDAAGNWVISQDINTPGGK